MLTHILLGVWLLIHAVINGGGGGGGGYLCHSRPDVGVWGCGCGCGCVWCVCVCVCVCVWGGGGGGGSMHVFILQRQDWLDITGPYIGDKWSIHSAKQHKDNQSQSLKQLWTRYFHRNEFEPVLLKKVRRQKSHWNKCNCRHTSMYSALMKKIR